MNDQNNQEEEEYEEEEIEVYEEVEVDEDAEVSDIVSSKKKLDIKNIIKKEEEIKPFTDNFNIPKKKDFNNNNKEDIIDYNKLNKENNQIIIENKIKNIVLDSSNDNVNKEVSDNRLLDDKLKFVKNGYENDNLKVDDKIDYMNNFNNNNIDKNFNNDNNIQFNNFNTTNISNNDFNFDFSNNFNFDNKNSENKYLNLDYKIIPGRESIDITNEMKVSNNYEKKESNLIPSSTIKEEDNNNINNNNINNINNNNVNNINNINNNNVNNINNNNVNNINNNINNNYTTNNDINNKEITRNNRQPQGHRSKIRRNNNKKLINLNNNNNNNNINNNYQNNEEDTTGIQNTEKNTYFKKESYFKDNENNNNIINISNNNINNEFLQLTERPIKTSLNNMITSQNDYQTNYIFKNQESININQEISEYCKNNNESNLNSDQNKQKIPTETLYNTINTNMSQNLDLNTILNNQNNVILNEKDININEQELNYNTNINTNKNTNIDINVQNDNEIKINNENENENDNKIINEEKKPVNEENKIIDDKDNNINNTNINNNPDINYSTNINVENKKKPVAKKSKEELEYESIFGQLSGNNEIIELLDSRKWEEKKQGFLKLNQFLNEKIGDKSIMENNFENIFMFIVLKLNNFKETNFNLLKEGILCLQILFSYYKEKKTPLDKRYLDKILFGLNEKIADSKLKEVYLQLLKPLTEIYSYKTVYGILFEILLKTNKMTVLKEYGIYFRESIKEQNSINDIDLKNMIDFIVKIANHTNPQIRSLSIEIICLLYKFIGPDLKQLISGIKESTFKLIEKELEKINFNDKDNENDAKTQNKIKDLLTKNKAKKNNANKGDLNKNSSATNITNSMSSSNLINNKRTDISKEITPKLLKEINRGKWIEKKEGIEYINSVIDKANNKISKNGLQELFDLIKEKLNDGNINLVKMTLQLLNHLIVALDNQIKAFYKVLVYPLLLKLSDKNKQIRDECHACIENWIKMQNFEIFAVYLPQLLISTENFEMRNEILTLLNKNKELIKGDFPKLFFKELTKAFLTCLQDKNATIRNSTEELIKSLSTFIPREKYVLELKDIKRSIADNLYNVLDKLLPKQDTGTPKVVEANNGKNENKEKEKNDNNDKEKDEDLLNDDTILHHQQLVPNKRNNGKKNNIRLNKKVDGTHSMDKNSFKLKKKDNSIVNEIKNKTILNATINSTLFENNKEKENLKKNSCIINNKKGKNKVLSCDKVPSNIYKKLDKTKFSTLNLNTETNTNTNNIRNLNKKNNNYLNTTSRPDIKKTNKKARNRSMITEKNNDNNNSKIIGNYYTKKDVKSLTAEKVFKNKNNLNTSRILQNQKKNLIKEQPAKKVNPKKFINNNISRKKNQIFLPNYKIKKGFKEKRYEKDKKNNFYFEVQNFDYLPKVSELLKTIFTPEFISKIFSNDLKLINSSLSQLKILIDESINSNNDENYNKLIDNLDLILKVIGIKVSSNQTASLIKSFFIFADTLINSYKIKNYTFNDTEINILLNIFADKLTNNNLILKETACNLIYFLNDQIESSKTFVMLIHLFEYKNAKLKTEIIDIILKLYDTSNFDITIISKVLKILVRAYFEADFNSKKKVLSLLQDIYNSIGDDFWKYTKNLSSTDRDELVKYLVPENEKEMDKKDTSREYEIDDLNSSNFGDDDSDNNEINNNNINNNNDNNRRDSKYDNNNNLMKYGNNYDYDYDNLKTNLKDNITIEKQNKKHIFKRSRTDNSKKEQKKEDGEISNIDKNNFNTNIITTNINDINSINNKNKDSDSKCITEKELKEALDMLVNPEEDLVEAIINIHCITYRNYLQNKKVLNSKTDNIISCFIEVINKLFLNKPLRIKIIKYYIVVLCKLCNIKEFIINISLNIQKSLIILILSNLLYENLNTLGDNDEGMVIWKSLNSMISHIIEYCEVTKNISIIIELEQKYRKEKPKLAEYSARCLVIITQNIKNTYKSIDLKIIFNNVYSILDDFIKETSDLQLKEKTDQTILITLRNLINELVKAKMENILEDYNIWIKENNIIEEKYILNWINESLIRIKKLKNNEDEDTNVNGTEDGDTEYDKNENVNNNNENEQIIIGNKRKSLDEIKKKWKELQEKNNNNK